MTCTNNRRAALVAALVAGGMTPWTGYLALTLPATATAAHWPLAWVGLDVGTIVAAVTSAVLLARRHARADLALVASAAILLVDAWFDTTTASGPDVIVSVTEAVLVELPLAVAAVVTALRVGRPDPAPIPVGSALVGSAS